MKPRRLDFSDVRLYGVTAPVSDPDRTLAVTKTLVENGVDAIQLRSRELADRALFDLARKMADVCRENGALFLIDNRPDLAVAADADGVHVGHEDLPLSVVRSLIGHRKILGASAHSIPQALEAQRNGADYVSCGPIWATPSKPQYEAVGLGLIGLYRAAVRVPFVAIGGIDAGNVADVVAAGAARIAVVRGLYDAADPAAAARAFAAALTQAPVQARL